MIVIFPQGFRKGVAGNTQAATPTDEIHLDFDMFVGRQAAESIEGDVVLTKGLLIEFAKDFWELRRQRQLKTQLAD